jgi:hypothetical protein
MKKRCQFQDVAVLLLPEVPEDWPGSPAGVQDHAVDEQAHLKELASEVFDHHRQFSFPALGRKTRLMLKSFDANTSEKVYAEATGIQVGPAD